MATVVSKKVDKKGRVMIPELADSMVIIESVGIGEFLVKAAEVIPASEAWLYKNRKAKASLEKGILEAKSRKFASGPLDSGEDMSWVSELED